MSDSSEDRCAICSGTRQEHNNGTKHMFTMNPGELRLPPRVQEQVRREGRGSSDAALVIVSRLIEILVDNDLITHEEGLSCYKLASVPKPPSEVVNVT